jgi:hypothetical protein
MRGSRPAKLLVKCKRGYFANSTEAVRNEIVDAAPCSEACFHLQNGVNGDPNTETFHPGMDVRFLNQPMLWRTLLRNCSGGRGPAVHVRGQGNSGKFGLVRCTQATGKGMRNLVSSNQWRRIQ